MQRTLSGPEQDAAIAEQLYKLKEDLEYVRVSHDDAVEVYISFLSLMLSGICFYFIFFVNLAYAQELLACSSVSKIKYSTKDKTPCFLLSYFICSSFPRQRSMYLYSLEVMIQTWWIGEMDCVSR